LKKVDQEWYENQQILWDIMEDVSKNFVELLVTVNITL